MKNRTRPSSGIVCRGARGAADALPDAVLMVIAHAMKMHDPALLHGSPGTGDPDIPVPSYSARLLRYIADSDVCSEVLGFAAATGENNDKVLLRALLRGCIYERCQYLQQMWVANPNDLRFRVPFNYTVPPYKDNEPPYPSARVAVQDIENAF